MSLPDSSFYLGEQVSFNIDQAAEVIIRITDGEHTFRFMRGEASFTPLITGEHLVTVRDKENGELLQEFSFVVFPVPIELAKDRYAFGERVNISINLTAEHEYRLTITHGTDAFRLVDVEAETQFTPQAPGAYEIELADLTLVQSYTKRFTVAPKPAPVMAESTPAPSTQVVSTPQKQPRGPGTAAPEAARILQQKFPQVEVTNATYFAGNRKHDVEVRGNGRNSLRLHGVEDYATIGEIGFSGPKGSVKTDIVTVENATLDNATIRLAKHGSVGNIVRCDDYEAGDGSCPGGWTDADIPFEDHGDFVEFTVSHFSSYGGNSSFGWEYLDNDTVFHFWNEWDEYFINASSGVQLTNHYADYWTRNIFCGGYKTSGWNYVCSDSLPFTWSMSSDNLSYINYTGWRDHTIGPYTVRYGIRYSLKPGDRNLSITVGARNIGGTDITNDLGFAWRITDIRINMNYTDNIYFLNGSLYNASDSLNLSYTNITPPRFFAYHEPSNEFLYMAWQPSLNYLFRVQNVSGQYNAPATLLINGGGLAVGQTKSTTFNWLDGPSAPNVLSSVSDDPDPVLQGQTITFYGTGTSTRNYEYALHVCTTNSISCDKNDATDYGACDVTSICASTIELSGQEASCTHDTSGESGSQTWYMFTCNENGDQSDYGSNPASYSVTVDEVASFTTDLAANATTVIVGESINFTATASDPEGDNYQLTVCDTDSITGNYPGTCNGGNTLCTSEVTVDDAEASCVNTTIASMVGTFNAYGFVCDEGTGSCNTTSTSVEITVSLGEPEVHSFNASPNPGANGTTITVTANITDNTGVSAASAERYYPNGTFWGNTTLTSGGGDMYTGTFTAPSSPLGNYTLRLWANDTDGNVKNDNTTQFIPYINLTTLENITINGAFGDWDAVSVVADTLLDAGGLGFTVPDNELLVVGGNNDVNNMTVWAYDNGSSTYVVNWSTIANTYTAVDGRPAVGDLNHDGWPDFALTVYDGDQRVEIWNYDNVTRTWVLLTTLSEGGASAVEDWIGGIGDFDGDGRDELFILDEDDDQLEIWGNVSDDAQGFSLNTTLFTCGVDGGIYKPVISDLNDNGLPELVFQCNGNNQTNDELQIWEWNTTTETYKNLANISGEDMPRTATTGNDWSMVVDDMDGGADVTGDGVDDVVFCGNSNSVHVLSYHDGGYGLVFNATIYGTGDFTQTCGIGDLNGDGAADLYAGTGEYPVVVVHNHSNFVNIFNYSNGHIDDFGISASDAGDADNDGADELIIGNRSSGSNFGLFDNNSAETNNVGVFQDFGLQYSSSIAVLIADLDGDAVTGSGYDPNYDLKTVSFTSNRTHIFGRIAVNGSINLETVTDKYRLYLGNGSTGNSTSPEEATLPFPYTYFLQVNSTTCGVYNRTAEYVTSCSFDNTSTELEFGVLASTVGITDTDTINASFETAGVDTRYDLAPDGNSFLQLTFPTGGGGPTPTLTADSGFTGAAIINESDSTVFSGNCTCNDAACSNVKIWIQDNRTSVYALSSTSSGDDVYVNVTNYTIGSLSSAESSSTYTFNVTGKTKGNYNFRVLCNSTDATNDTSTAETLAVVDQVKPVITNAKINLTSPVVVNTLVRVNATLTDAHLDTVWLTVTPPLSAAFNATLTSDGSHYYNDTIQLDEVGQWTFIFHANDTSNNNATPVTAEDGDTNAYLNVIAYGTLDVTLLAPSDPTNINQDGLFWMNATVTCQGITGAECGMVYAYARYNESIATPDTTISNTSETTPFFIMSSPNVRNPDNQSLSQGESWTINWSVNATSVGSYETDVFFNSSYGSTNITDNDTSDATVSITALSPLTCGETLTEDTTFTQNYTCTGTAFTIGAPDIIIDGAGYTVTGNTTGYGFDNYGGYDNVTFKDLIITNFTNGIVLDSANNNTIHNNTINTSNDAIELSVCNGTNITNNTITTHTDTGAHGIGAFSGVDTFIQGNIINTTTGSSYGVFLFSSDLSRTQVRSNIITTSGSNANGIAIDTALNATIWNNTITTTDADAIYVTDAATTGLNLSQNTFSVGGSNQELDINTVGLNGITLYNQPLTTYEFAGNNKLTVINTTHGRISFIEGFDATSGSAFTSEVRLGQYWAYVNGTKAALNKSANVTLYNNPYNPAKIQRDGVDCPAGICTALTSLSIATVTFNVTGWSNYSLEDGLLLALTAPANATKVDRDGVHDDPDVIVLTAYLSNETSGITVTFKANRTEPTTQNGITIGSNTTNSSGVAVLYWNGSDSGGSKLAAGNYTWWGETDSLNSDARYAYIYGGLNLTFRYASQDPNASYDVGDTIKLDAFLNSYGPETDAEVNSTYLASVNGTMHEPGGTNYTVVLVDPAIIPEEETTLLDVLLDPAPYIAKVVRDWLTDTDSGGAP